MAKVGKYELVRKLATGGMAEVFLAKFEWARGLEKPVVVKRILYHLAEDPSFIEMFFTEAQLAAQLSHPNIAQIIEFGESEGVYFLAMEYIDGLSLRALAAAAHADGTGIPFPHCARIAAFCCEALTHAHELTDAATGKPLNLVHRDVSPDNVLISKTGSVKLVDFGIAKAATQNHQTKTGLVKGKLAYMSPEQLRAEPLDRRADIFSLGVLLFELVAGRKPYEAASEVTLIHAMLYEEMTALRTCRKDVPPELERIVEKALQRNRDKRYADCREMHADLEKYLLTSRQSVSALQIAELVEKYRHAPARPEGTPPQAMATPSRPVALAKTPEPWRAERTPAGAATAQLRQQRLQTGTDGNDARATELEMPTSAPPRPVEKTELVSAPKPPPPQAPPRDETTEPVTPIPQPPPKAPPRARRPTGARSPPARSRTPVILAAGATVVLLVVGIAFLRPLRKSPLDRSGQEAQSPSEQEVRSEQSRRGQGAVDEVDASVEVAAVVPAPPHQQAEPEPEPPPEPAAPSPAPKPVKPSPPMVVLKVRSEPAGTIKVFVGGKLRATHKSPLTARLPPGSVEIEASGSGEQSFLKRESLTLEAAARSVEHTIKAEQGTVMLRSFPASQLTVDGVPRGGVPLKLQLYEGPHAVRFDCDRSIPKCANGLEATKTFTIQPGKTVDVTQRWP